MSKARYLYSELATAIEARLGCLEPSANESQREWVSKWTERIERMQDMLPHGNGFDNGTKIDLDASHATKLVFHTSYHHMNDGGFYVGWTEHTITVTPTFRGIAIRVSGRNVNEIKDYIGKEFDYALEHEVSVSAEGHVQFVGA